MKLKVFIAEDEPVLQLSLEDVLADFGCDVAASVASVKEALAFFATDQAVDVAVLDVHLSDGPVDPVAARLAELGIPFVYATGAPGSEPSAAPVVAKPYDSVQIGRAIKAAMGRDD